jgi:hypothetical protein
MFFVIDTIRAMFFAAVKIVIVHTLSKEIPSFNVYLDIIEKSIMVNSSKFVCVSLRI